MIFIICSVRGATPEYRQKLEEYTRELEKHHPVYLPHRDTDQAKSGLAICSANATAIQMADEVHVFYSPDSQGTHFDMGVAFALKKPIKVVETGEIPEGKSFARMLTEWADFIRCRRIHREDNPNA